MPAPSSYDYAVIRVVPRVERGEFANVGVILSCPERDFLDALVHVDAARLSALDPHLDLETLRQHLASIPLVCRGDPAAGPVAALPARQRFHWLVSPRSAQIQTSPVHAGRCTDPAQELRRLLACMVLPPGS